MKASKRVVALLKKVEWTATYRQALSGITQRESYDACPICFRLKPVNLTGDIRDLGNSFGHRKGCELAIVLSAVQK